MKKTDSNYQTDLAPLCKGSCMQRRLRDCKKLLPILLSLCMLFSITTGIDLSAYAAGNTIATATSVSLNTTNGGSITDYNNTDVYKFTLESSGRITLSATAYIYRVSYRLYDSNGDEIFNPNTYVNGGYSRTEWNDKTGQSFISVTLDLTSGVYYFGITQYNGSGKYSFNISFDSAEESFDEPIGGNDNSIPMANAISLGKTYRGQIAHNDDKDFYKFVIKKNQTVTLKARAFIFKIAYYIYNSNGEEICNPNTYVNGGYSRTEWNGATCESFISSNIYLTPGTYYLGVNKYDGTGNYQFSISCAHSWKGAATKKATFNDKGVMTYTCTACGATKTSAISKIGTVSLSANKFAYNGKQIQPAVTVKNSDGKIINSNNYDIKYSSNCKNVGKYSVKVTFKGNYSGTKTLYFTIKPKNTSIASLTAGSKKFTVKLKKYTTQTTGYEIQYATNSNFKSAKTVSINNTTTSKTISKLAGKKKYYVRVRTYKTVNGTKYYSSWSKAKSVTTKK